MVTRAAGVLRDGTGLSAALESLRPHLDNDAGLVGYLVVWSALRREESRGGHTRTDFPTTAEHGEHTQVDLAAVTTATVR